MVHATTLATNLILERKGSKVAYITTKGFGDLFVIGKERVVGADRYNLFLEKSPPLVERRLTMEVEERINRLGEVVVPFNEREAVEGPAAAGPRRRRKRWRFAFSIPTPIPRTSARWPTWCASICPGPTWRFLPRSGRNSANTNGPPPR